MDEESTSASSFDGVQDVLNRRTVGQQIGSLRAGNLRMDWGFIVFVGTMLFFAALHQWPPDGRRWQREELTVKEEESRRRRQEMLEQRRRVS